MNTTDPKTADNGVDVGALLATRFLGGALSSATIPTAQAYVADVTTPENRAK